MSFVCNHRYSDYLCFKQGQLKACAAMAIASLALPSCLYSLKQRVQVLWVHAHEEKNGLLLPC